MSTPETRALVLDLIAEAVAAGAREAPACAVLGLTARTLRRWRALAGGHSGLVDQRTCTQRVPGNRLSPEEQQAILAIANVPEHRSLPPTQIVPRLADQGVYIASESSFYRVLRAHDQVQRRGRAATPRHVPKPEGVCATAPNAAWCWDIERHEALSDRATVQDRRDPAVAAAGDKLRAARTGERQQGWQAALTKPGRGSIVRCRGFGEQMRKV
jgi:hypothetical protein